MLSTLNHCTSIMTGAKTYVSHFKQDQVMALYQNVIFFSNAYASF